AWLVGGDDFDGITAIAAGGAASDQLVLAGWFTGTLPTGERADGIDDVFVAAGPATGPGAVEPLPSADPASISALTATPAGFVLAVHTSTPTLHVRGL
ncbi:MAG: hypothetical protein K8M05_30580, partial [Deltaproteobacteria bacterium]|nr:hypothetical protein [Kofleriaceae bacterium]